MEKWIGRLLELGGALYLGALIVFGAGFMIWCVLALTFGWY